MAEKVFMPQLGESVTEGTISKWLVQVGTRINKYDPLCEVSTDKVNAEIPSAYTGTITEIAVSEGETVDVGTLICYIQPDGKAEPSAAVADTEKPAAEDQTLEAASIKQRYSPAVHKLASEHSVDLGSIHGTGAGGRVTRKDVLAFIEKGERNKVQPASVPASAAPDQAEAKPAAAVPALARDAGPESDEAGSRDGIIPVTSVRKAIASRMVQSKHDAPHAWMMVECDVTSLVEYRSQVKDEFKKKEGMNLTYLPFFIKAVVESLKEYPMLNSVWAGDHILVKKDIHISIAVAANDALFVPVIRDADQKSIFGIAKSIDDLARRTRAGKLRMEDMSGGTFTVNNTGSFGSVLSAPIINPPQAAIVSVESIVKRPVVINQMIAVRDMVNICLSLDHRILDGLVCGRFLQHVKQKMESYGPNTKLY